MHGGRESRRPRPALGCSAIDDDDVDGEDVQLWLNATYPGRWIGCEGQLHGLLGQGI
jgi:hypothetical protein